ncbi:hypothetical protein [Caenibius sp. WL]|uniref:hypothetical protein n=1 Tax=Caenibius sp. WL TaxID=2872646 RepID=UPI001C999C13|nr:hypothetical protein [Caenibius sp. WL]QZP06939.1 hypothetical protein K5X80_09440 [Caenibius sp. WL]
MNDTPAQGFPVEWEDHSELHRKDDGGGVFSGLKTIRSGTLAELVAFVARLPEDERANYEIAKSGDHRLSLGEIMALASRPDFPGANA